MIIEGMLHRVPATTTGGPRSTGVRSETSTRSLADFVETVGIDLAGHRARDLSQLNLESFDLVLGFERMHVRAAVVDGFARIERTFTLPDLIELLESIPEPSSRHDPVEQARDRVAQAHGLRSPDFRSSAVAEIADPLGRTAREQRRTAHELQELVGRLARALFA